MKLSLINLDLKRLSLHLLHNILHILFSGVLILAAVSVQAEVHHWVDEYGQSHFGDKPPNLSHDVKSYERVGAYKLKNLVDMVLSDPVQISDRVKKAQSSARPSKKYRSVDRQVEKKCARMRDQLKKVQYQLRVGYKEPKGNQLRKKRRFISGELYKNCS